MSIHTRLVLLGAVATILTPATAAGPVGQLVVDIDRTVSGTVNNAPMRFSLVPNGSSVPVLSPEAAQRAGLKKGWLNVRAMVGPVRIKGHTAVVRYTAPGTALKRRIGWFERNIVPGYDGEIGPSAVSALIVTFRLRANQGGEREYHMPLTDFGYMGLGSSIRIGKEVVRISFEADSKPTVVSAATGSLLEETNGAHPVGATFRHPIAFGVERPLRRLEFKTWLAFGPFRFSSVNKRANSEGPAQDSGDPDEIIVTAKKKAKGPKFITIGRDALAHCSSVTFDKAKKEVRLWCK